MEADGPEPVLEYAPKRVFPWKKLFRKMAVIAGAVLIVGAAVFLTKDYVGRWWWTRKVMAARRACAAATLPATAVVFAFDGGPFRGGWSMNTPEEKAAQLINLHDLDSLAFLHERKTASGKVRIVALRVESMRAIGGDGFFGYKMLAEPRENCLTGFWASDEFDVRLADGTLLRPIAGRPMKIFAGQADATDESHFTVEYEVNGVRGVLDGRLEDNPSPGAAEIVRLVDRGAVKK